MSAFILGKRNVFSGLFICVSLLLSSCYSLKTLESISERSQASPVFESADGVVIDQADVAVKIQSQTALTSIKLTITNTTDRDEEGFLRLVLPPNAVVIGYALDIEDQMRPAVAIPKALAQKAYDDITARGVDPSVLKVSEGNVFNLEIFPIFAQGQRQVRIDYIEPISKPTGAKHQWQLNLSQFEDLAVDLKIDIDGVRKEPLITGHKLGFKKSSLNKRKARFTAEGTAKVAEGKGDIHISYLPKEREKVTTSIGQADDGLHYFTSQLSLGDEVYTDVATSAESLTIFWDSSLSMQAHHRRNRAIVLEAISRLKTLKAVTLILFSNVAGDTQKFSASEQEDDLANALDAIIYDGASNLYAPFNVIMDSEPDLAWFFSDGVHSIGREQPVSLSYPLNTVVPSGASNRPRLVSLSDTSKGGFTVEAHTSLARTAELLTQKVQDYSVDTVPASAVQNAVVSWSFNDAVSVNVSGQLLGQARLSLNSDQGESIVLELSPNQEQSQIPKQAWVMANLNLLLKDKEANFQKIQDFGVKYGVVTPYTSLLVLEEIEDYARYGIEPPEGVDTDKEYKELVAEFAKEDAEDQEYLTEFIQQQWEQRIAWWQAQDSMTLEEAQQQFKLLNRKREESAEEIIVMGVRRSGPPAYQEQGSAMLEEVIFVPNSRRGAEVTDSIHAEDIGMVPSDAIPEALNRIAGTPDRVVAASIKLEDSVSTSDEIYIAQLNAVDVVSRYPVYLALRKNYLNNPKFYIDVAAFFEREGEVDLAYRILSNIAEQRIDIASAKRMLAYKLTDMGKFDESISLFEQLAYEFPYMLNSYRDLAIVWEKWASVTGSNADYQRAADYYLQTVVRTDRWSEDEDPARIIALMELNSLLSRFGSVSIDADALPVDLPVAMPLDLRITVGWNLSESDLDLWVTEPTGEDVGYSNDTSVAGGFHFDDVTDGFGPEEYLHRFSLEGDYDVKVNIYSDDSLDTRIPLTATLNIFRNYGRPEQTVVSTTVPLKAGEKIKIGTISVER